MSKTRFKDLNIGEYFRVGYDRFIKTNDHRYPNRVPLHEREHNCINLNNRHRCVMGDEVEVDAYEREDNE